MEDSHLADEYVQDFVLEHLEDTAVKREEPSPPSNKVSGAWTTVVEEPPTIHMKLCSRQQHAAWHHEKIRLQTLSPPSEMYSGPMAAGQPILVNAAVAGAPTTPPETPPGPGSPNPPCSQDYAGHYTVQRQGNGLMDDMMFLPDTMRLEQPLDLRHLHCDEAEWNRRGYMQSSESGMAGPPFGIQHHHLQHLEHMGPLHSGSYPPHGHMPRPLSGSSSGTIVVSPRQSGGQHSASCSSGSKDDDDIDDDLLMSLSVRELNKRLHGFPRETVVRYKQKRRTLKNRGYAQNCRSKRLQQRHDLEITNRSLHNELNRVKIDLERIRQERDQLKQMLMPIGHGQNGGGPPGSGGPQQSVTIHSDGTGSPSPEFYL
ncbi:MAF [Sergentomyia squamirostris]